MLARACRRAAQMPCRSQNIWEEVMRLNRIAALLTTGIAATGAGFLPLSATAQDEVNTSPAGATQADTAASAANSAAQPDAASTDSDIAEVIVTADRKSTRLNSSH